MRSARPSNRTAAAAGLATVLATDARRSRSGTAPPAPCPRRRAPERGEWPASPPWGARPYLRARRAPPVRSVSLLFRGGLRVDGKIGGGLLDGAEVQRLAARALIHVDVVAAHRRRGRHLLGQAVRGRLSLALARSSRRRRRSARRRLPPEEVLWLLSEWVGNGWKGSRTLDAVLVIYDRRRARGKPGWTRRTHLPVSRKGQSLPSAFRVNQSDVVSARGHQSLKSRDDNALFEVKARYREQRARGDSGRGERLCREEPSFRAIARGTTQQPFFERARPGIGLGDYTLERRPRGGRAQRGSVFEERIGTDDEWEGTGGSDDGEHAYPEQCRKQRSTRLLPVPAGRGPIGPVAVEPVVSKMGAPPPLGHFAGPFLPDRNGTEHVGPRLCVMWCPEVYFDQRKRG